MKALRPTAPGWQFAGTSAHIGKLQPDHGIWWHFGRELTVISGVGIADDGEWLHVSVSRWGTDTNGKFMAVMASDAECSWALEQFGFQTPPPTEATGPDQASRDFIARVQ